MNINRMGGLICLVMLLSVNHEAVATGGGVSNAFSEGSTRISIVAGSGSAFRENYFIVGAGAGYYVATGLELGIDVQRWFSGSPSITKISPQVSYVFTRVRPVKPYIGVFYRRTMIDNLKDVDSLGYRAGAYFTSNNGVYIGAGLVYEEYKDCSVFLNCSYSYPEVIISLSF